MQIHKFYNNLEDSDILIVHNEGNIYCHRVILKAGSTVLDLMLKNPMLEKQENVIKLLTFKTSSVVTCIKHIYQIKLKDLPDRVKELEDLIDLCNYLDLHLLKLQIDHHLFDLVFHDKENKYDMEELFLMSIKYEMSNLMECTAAHIFQKKSGINKLNLEQYRCFRNIVLSFEKKYQYGYLCQSDLFSVAANMVLKMDCQWASANKDKEAMQYFLSSYSFDQMDENIIEEILEYEIIKSQAHLLTLLTAIINLKKKPAPRNYY